MSPKPSQPPRNLTTNGTAPVDLHRFPDATQCVGAEATVRNPGSAVGRAGCTGRRWRSVVPGASRYGWSWQYVVAGVDQDRESCTAVGAGCGHAAQMALHDLVRLQQRWCRWVCEIQCGGGTRRRLAPCPIDGRCTGCGVGHLVLPMRTSRGLRSWLGSWAGLRGERVWRPAPAPKRRCFSGAGDRAVAGGHTRREDTLPVVAGAASRLRGNIRVHLRASPRTSPVTGSGCVPWRSDTEGRAGGHMVGVAQPVQRQGAVAASWVNRETARGTMRCRSGWATGSLCW